MAPLAGTLQDRRDILRERGCGLRHRRLRMEAGCGGEYDGAAQGGRNTPWCHLGKCESRDDTPRSMRAARVDAAADADADTDTYFEAVYDL